MRQQSYTALQKKKLLDCETPSDKDLQEAALIEQSLTLFGIKLMANCVCVCVRVCAHVCMCMRVVCALCACVCVCVQHV